MMKKKILACAFVVFTTVFAMYGTWKSSCKASVSNGEVLLDDNIEALSDDSDEYGSAGYHNKEVTTIPTGNDVHYIYDSDSTTAIICEDVLISSVEECDDPGGVLICSTEIKNDVQHKQIGEIEFKK